jgi:hypothetical protein
MLTEANRFVWPGPDLRMKQSGDAASMSYGLLPRALLKEISNRFADAIDAQLARMIPRTE